MAQVTTGLYRASGIPWLYRLIQGGLAKSDALERIARDLIGARPGARVLDLGCGSAAILSYLPAECVYWGIDSNPLHIRAARGAYRERGVFECGNAASLAAFTGADFDLVLMIGLLHHLDDGDAVDALAGAAAALRPGGRLFAIDPAWEPNQHPIARFLIGRDAGRSVRDAEGYRKLAIPFFPSLNVDIRRDLLRVPYTHCVLQGELTAAPA